MIYMNLLEGFARSWFRLLICFMGKEADSILLQTYYLRKSGVPASNASSSFECTLQLENHWSKTRRSAWQRTDAL